MNLTRNVENKKQLQYLNVYLHLDLGLLYEPNQGLHQLHQQPCKSNKIAVTTGKTTILG